MKNLRFLLLHLFILTCALQSSSHPRHTDPVLEELNDYLMAIQVMRIYDEQAEEIFQSWVGLREESWKIRSLTDDDELAVQSDRVMKQIGLTRRKQKSLLAECRTYFDHIARNGPFVEFRIGNDVEVTSPVSAISVQVQHQLVVPIRIVNSLDSIVEVDLSSGYSDEILFWDKSMLLSAGTNRYTFLICAPLREHFASSELMLKIGSKQVSSQISLRGTPTKNPPFRLMPGTPYRVALPDSSRSMESSADWKQSISLDITDALTGQPLAVRVEVFDNDSTFYWSPLRGKAMGLNRAWGWNTPLWDHQPGPYFYMKGPTELGVNPVGKKIRIFCGFEYKPVTMNVPDDGRVNVEMQRWVNMPLQGWYSGQTHIHTTDAGMPVQFDKNWPLVSQGEDLHVSAVLTLKGEWATHAVYANEYPMGLRSSFSTNEHLIFYGEEYRNNPYGHLIFLGIDRLIQPISSGALGELGGEDYPPNTYPLDQALDQGANTIAAHFGLFRRGSENITTPWPSTGFEMPVDVALGKVQLAEIMGNGGQLDVWYDLLNCGFRIAATAGPDWVIKDSPRVYVQLEEMPFKLDNWLQAHKEGRSFITQGPMLDFTVNGEMAGTDITSQTDTINVRIQARATLPNEDVPLEILINGKVIAEGIQIDTSMTLTESAWIAARGDDVHSNPIYVSFEDRPLAMASSAKKFVEVIERLKVWVQEKGLFYDEARRQEVLKILDQGLNVYVRIIESDK